MPITEDMAICHHCVKLKYVHCIINDAQPVVCPECEDAGHVGSPLDCPLCRPARRARIDAALTASLGAPLTPEERRKRLRVRAALAESRAAGDRPSEALRWIAEALMDRTPCIDADGNFTLEDDIHEHDC
jgi:hypothetical protein